jgi:hypothetical protein
MSSVFSQSVQQETTSKSPICPRCRKLMVFVGKKRIMFTDARAQASYRCLQHCGGADSKNTLRVPLPAICQGDATGTQGSSFAAESFLWRHPRPEMPGGKFPPLWSAHVDVEPDRGRRRRCPLGPYFQANRFRTLGLRARPGTSTRPTDLCCSRGLIGSSSCSIGGDNGFARCSQRNAEWAPWAA